MNNICLLNLNIFFTIGTALMIRIKFPRFFNIRISISILIATNKSLFIRENNIIFL